MANYEAELDALRERVRELEERLAMLQILTQTNERQEE